MNEAIQKFVGLECIVNTIDVQVIGTIEEVAENWLLLRTAKGGQEIINLEFISRIREYPKNKNGKK